MAIDLTIHTPRREFVQGAFARVFCTRPNKNQGGSEMCDVLYGWPLDCLHNYDKYSCHNLEKNGKF